MSLYSKSFKERSFPKTANLRFASAIFFCAALVLSLAAEKVHAAGTVVAWGGNDHSQSAVPAGLTNVTAVAGGSAHSLALTSSGTVSGWGDNSSGEINAPASLTNAVAIAAGNNFSLALRSDGSVTSWGSQTTVPAGLNNAVAIAAASTSSMALTRDGNVVVWGSAPTPPATVTNAVAISAGYAHGAALKGDGTVVVWGDNTWGQTNLPSGLTNIVALSAGEYHTLALRSDGKVIAWGDNTWNQSKVPTGLSNVIAIAAGAYHSLALKQDGTVVAWGDNTYFQTNIPDGLANVVGIAAGRIHNLAVVGDGSPVITVQPVGQYNAATDIAYFRVTAAGQVPLSYQWQQDGTNIIGATSPLLSLTNLSMIAASTYTVIVTNSLGATISLGAQLPPAWRPPPCDPPLIFSVPTSTGKQGIPFNYTILAQNNPYLFMADGLPGGLSINPTSGVITGTPLESGTFNIVLKAVNPCTSAQTNLTLVIASSVPVITSKLAATGTEQAGFNYQIKATESPTSFNAVNLPQGLSVDPASGIISGSPLFAGSYTVSISASNVWGTGSASLQLSVANKKITGLSIANLLTNYSAPYLLNFQFSLRDNNNPALGNAVVTDPRNLTVTALEDGQPVSPSGTAVFISPASAKVLKAYLVLDFGSSIASTNNNGISDAVNAEVDAAQEFVNQQPDNAQIGVYEFHREDEAPNLVQSLTTDKTLLNNSIAGIWTNYVQGFPAGSRCWDALVAAINNFGTNSPDEAHYVIFLSDGQDTSSTNTFQDVIAAAGSANVQVYCVGFGNTIDTATLQAITSQTQGRYYEAADLTTLAVDFAQIGKDLSGQYLLRWATLQRSANFFMPSFKITYQGLTAVSPPNPVSSSMTNVPVLDTNGVAITNADGTTEMTNITILTTNYIISPYQPTAYAGDVTVGSLRLISSAVVQPSAITLRATYIPRYIRQIRLHYRANWPCAVNLESTDDGEPLSGWSLTQTNDGAGGQWALLTSSNPQDLGTSIPFASFGPLLNFAFHDVINASNAFSFFDVDNTVYTNTGNQSFGFENTNAFITVYPALPYGTPVPWLIGYGFTDSTAWAADETNDLNGNGLMVWQDYVAGLNPTNASSVFAVQNLAPTGPAGKYQVTFSTVLNRTYRVETSSDLLSWQTLQDGVAGTGGNVTVTDTRFLPATTPAFYRVVVY